MRLKSVAMVLCLAGASALQAQQADTVREICVKPSLLYGGCTEWKRISPAQKVRVDTVRDTVRIPATSVPATSAQPPGPVSAAVSRTPQRQGGSATAPTTARGTVSPTTSARIAPGGKDREVARIDTVLERITINTHSVDTLRLRDTVPEIRYVTRYDTTFVTREVRKGFPWWRTLGAVVLVGTGICEVASRQYGNDDWKFQCFGGPRNVTNNNTNINMSIGVGPRRIDIIFSRRP